MIIPNLKPVLKIDWRAVLGNMGVNVSEGVTKSFYFAFITTGVAAGLTYYALVRIFPQETYNLNKGMKFREWSPGEVEMYAAGSGMTQGRPVAPLQRTESDDEKKMDVGVVTSVLTV